tara:strand:- start:613 stop:825 length:213 start_codon:yes stop_codon:yes gene_type:complete
MFELYARVEDCGNGFGYSILHDEQDGIYEIAALKDGKYWPNTIIHDSKYGYPLRGDWALVVRTMVKIARL